MDLNPNLKTNRFIADLFAQEPTDDCIIWPFAREHGGYGLIWFRGKMWTAHSLICSMSNGDRPGTARQFHAAHSCANGHLGCVNPKHLSWKTVSENQQDRFRDGGSKRPRRLLTEDDVRYVRKKIADNANQRILAKELGVTDGTISHIRSGRTWGWLV